MQKVQYSENREVNPVKFINEFLIRVARFKTIGSFRFTKPVTQFWSSKSNEIRMSLREDFVAMIIFIGKTSLHFSYQIPHFSYQIPHLWGETDID
jgi:hypothetical protein